MEVPQGISLDDDLNRRALSELIRRRRMQESLVGFAESIKIPLAPVREGDWLDEALEADSDEDEICIPEPGMTLALHHKVLLEAIERTMSKRYGRLMVFMPPGAAKSTYTSVVAPCWAMGVNPGLQIILASYATPIAKKLGGRGRMICDQKIYQKAFGTEISRKTQAKEMWALTNQSEYMSGGLLSGLTGNRAGGVIIDDPVKGRKDAESKVVREATLAAYEDDLSTRMVPGAWQIIIQTRWALEDLAGSILPKDYDGESGIIPCRDGSDWEVLNIPAKAERPDDPLGRKIGEYLWPEWFDARHWSLYEPRPGDDAGPSQRRWAALFQQRPRPDEGNMFEEEWFNRYELGQHPPALNYYGASDYATVEDEGDYTEHGVAGLDNKGHLWFVDWFFGRCETDVGIDNLLRLAGKWQLKYGFGETGIIRRAIEPALQRRMKDLIVEGKLKHRLHIEYLHPAGTKASRLYAFQSLVHSGKVWIPNCPWGDRLIEHLCAFPSAGIPDDGPDVCSLLGRGLSEAKWSSSRVMNEEPKGITPFTWEWLTHGSEPKAPVSTTMKLPRGRVM